MGIQGARPKGKVETDAGHGVMEARASGASRLARSVRGALLATVVAAVSVGCADAYGEEEDVDMTGSAASSSEDEYAFLHTTYRTYVAGANNALYAPLRDTTGVTDEFEQGRLMNSYYRATCSLALVGAVVAREEGRKHPDGVVIEWIRDALRDYRNFSRDEWGRHVKLAPALDCLLAASVARPYLDPADGEEVYKAVTDVANAVMSGKGALTVQHYRDIGRTAPGNTQAEEAAITAAFLWAASRLVPVEGSSAWHDRAKELFQYAGMIAPPNAEDFDGEPFRRQSVTGVPLGADETVVSNHGLEVSPYYSLGALISYADAAVVRRATKSGGTLPAGALRVARSWSTEQRTYHQLGVAEIFRGGLRRLDRDTFGFTGAYRFIGEDGKANVSLDYGAQTHTIPSYPPGSELIIPTAGVGRGHSGRTTVSQFYDPRNETVMGYQITGGDLYAFGCANEDRGTFCRARFKAKLADAWRPDKIAGQDLFGGRPLPTADVDAMPQWVDAEGAIHTEVFSRGWVHSYVCAGDPRTCRAVDVVDLATHYKRYGFSPDDLPPTAGIDAASAFVHVDGTGRRYWTKDGRIWRARCDASFRSCSAETLTLAQQFGGLSFSTPLPTDRVDALTQFVRGGVLSSYVFRGDRVWKYDCTTSGCNAVFTRSLFEQWRDITNQERWADRTAEPIRGVTDWGVQATMMNATFALAHALKVDDDAYGRLLARQKSTLKLASRPLFPSTFDPKTGDFGYGRFAGAYPVGRYGDLAYLQDGWTARYPTFAARLNSYTWMNAFAGRNHAVAYMLLSGQALLEPFCTRDDGVVVCDSAEARL